MNGNHQSTESRARTLTLLAASLGFAVVQLDVSVVNVAIEAIGSELGGGVSGLQWVVSAYTIVFAALILTAGALGDRLGAKRLFVGGFALFIVASVICGLAPSLPVLIGARALQGSAAAVLVPCSLTLLNHTFAEPAERAWAVGLWAAGASVALAGGPLVGGALITAIGWRAIFFINVPLGLLGISITTRWAAETPRDESGRVDLGGAATAVAGLALLAGAVIEGGSRGFGDPVVLVGFALAAAVIAAFVLIEHRQARPMLPLELFRSPTFTASSAIGLLINVAFYGLIFVFSLYFQRVRGFSAIETGLAFVPTTLAVMVANLSAGRAGARFGTRLCLCLGALMVAAGAAALLGIGATSPYGALVAQLTLVGLGLGLVVPLMTSSLLGSVDARRSGVASGALNTARQAGSVIGVALFGALAGGDLVAGLQAALAISVGLAIAVAVLAAKVAAPAGSRTGEPLRVVGRRLRSSCR
jgi:DHA2 family methylenomycin A resistance protein-like MFS transporter